MKLAGLFIASVFAAAALGEGFLLLGYFGLILVAWNEVRNRIVSWLAISTCALALVLHFFGFKLFGRPAVAELQSLKSPRRVKVLEPPDVLRFEDGGSVRMANVFFPIRIDFGDETTNHFGIPAILLLINHELRLQYEGQKSIEVELVNPAASVSQAYCMRRAIYWCGNTWSPHFFPERLPRHVRDDFAAVLVSRGVALPTADYVAQANPYLDPLLHRLTPLFLQDLPPLYAEVVRLGHKLIERNDDEGSQFYGQDYLALGAQLLIETRAINSFSLIRKRLRERLARTNNSGPTSSTLQALLNQLDSWAAESAPDMREQR
jgi:hypothetical protein